MKIFRDGFCRKGFRDKVCVRACTPRNGTDGHSSRRLLLKGVQGQGMRGCFYTHTLERVDGEVYKGIDRAKGSAVRRGGWR